VCSVRTAPINKVYFHAPRAVFCSYGANKKSLFPRRDFNPGLAGESRIS
jgi:hypothetical protein